MMFALFSFVIYYNLLNLGQRWISTGQVEFLPFLLGLHGGIFGLGLLWLAKQHNHWSLRLRARRAPPSPLPGGSA